MNKKFYTLKNDKVFKNVFFRNKDLFKWLLNRTLIDTEKKINNFNFLNCELTKDRVYIRSKIVDILTHDLDNDYLYNIELNTVFVFFLIKRNYSFQCGQLTNIVHVSKNYSEDLKPVIQVNYNFNSILKNKDSFFNRVTDMNIKSNEIYPFFKEIINIDIDDYIDKWYNLNKDKDFYEKYKHFLLIGMSRDDLLELEDNDIMVKKIKDEVIKLNQDPKFYQFLTDEEDLEKLRNSYYSKGIKEGIQEGILEGIQEGKLQGIQETKISNAKKMKINNLSLDLISDITGLDKALIASL